MLHPHFLAATPTCLAATSREGVEIGNYSQHDH
jgi:hypothetical protein